MVQKLRAPQSGETFQRRKAIAELVFGVLKEQRAMRRFRRRGLEKVAVEMTPAATGFNVRPAPEAPRSANRSQPSRLMKN